MVHGIHHITAIASDPQATYDFYTKTLGLRLVKKSVNQDDVQTYHLFFGDRTGSPGMDLTFFTFQPATQGRRGAGLVTTISLAVPDGSLEFWQERFTTLAVKHQPITEKFGTRVLRFFDGDDQQLELVGVPTSPDEETDTLWTTKEIKTQQAIRSFYSATLSVETLSAIEPILLLFGYEKKTSEDTRTLYKLPHIERAAYLEVEELPPSNDVFNASGTVHHIAFSVHNEDEQDAVRAQLVKLGIYPTQAIDRYYFVSVYFRTPAGILFELATEEPGFTADEPLETLGEKLALPPFLEKYREAIEANLPPIEQEK